MKAGRISGVFFSILSVLSLVIGIYGICYETMDIFGPERAKGTPDLTPYLILICAAIFSASLLPAIVLLRKSGEKKSKGK